MKKTTPLFFALASLFFYPGLQPLQAQAYPAIAPQQAQQSAETQKQIAAWMIEALDVARNFTNHINTGNYAQTWMEGDPIFQKVVSQNEWVTALQLVRSKTGAPTSRTLKDEKVAFNPNGLPAGAYMVVEFNTSFEKIPNSGELLTLRRGDDGKWRVLTYQVN